MQSGYGQQALLKINNGFGMKVIAVFNVLFLAGNRVFFFTPNGFGNGTKVAQRFAQIFNIANKLTGVAAVAIETLTS